MAHENWTTNCKHKCHHDWGNWQKTTSTWGSYDIISQCKECLCYRYWKKSEEPKEEKTRANKQIWKLAEYLWNNFYHPDYEYESWELEEAFNRNKFYDKAKKLQYMFMFNAFSGEDDHSD